MGCFVSLCGGLFNNFFLRLSSSGVNRELFAFKLDGKIFLLSHFLQASTNKLKLAVWQYAEEFAVVPPTSGPVTGCLPLDEAYHRELKEMHMGVRLALKCVHSKSAEC